MKNRERISPQHALQMSIAALANVGTPLPNAHTQAELLVEAESRGRPSHGLLRLPRVIERIRTGVANPRSAGEHEWRAPSFLQTDGRQGLGPVVAFASLAHISERARQTGIAIAAVSNNNHLGMLALYAERVALAGQVLIALTTSEALVHPWGGRHAMLGTNPIAIGVPANPRPFVLDMATSLVSMGQIHDHAITGTPLKAGWALDSRGNPTTDAVAARDGAIAPFGGAKGYALGLAFEVLVSGLTASALGADVTGTLDAMNPCNKGDLFIVIEPNAKNIAAHVGAYLEQIRSCEPLAPTHPVAVPGDRARMQRQSSFDNGMEVDAEVWRAICSLANQQPPH